jgi:uncharacterized membrane protein
MKSKAAIGNHPIHPMLVTIPIGSFFLAFVGDLLHAATPKDPFWYDLSFTCLGIGLIFGVLAAVFGAIDYLGVPMSSRAFHLATWHALLNAFALAAFAATFIVRKRGTRRRGPCGRPPSASCSADSRCSPPADGSEESSLTSTASGSSKSLHRRPRSLRPPPLPARAGRRARPLRDESGRARARARSLSRRGFSTLPDRSPRHGFRTNS